MVGHRLAHTKLCVLSPAHRKLLRKVCIHISKEPLIPCASKDTEWLCTGHRTLLLPGWVDSFRQSFLYVPAAVKPRGVVTPDGHSVWIKS